MEFRTRSLSASFVMFLVAGLAAFSASATAQSVPVRGQTVPGHTANTPRQEPCWQVAGISKSAMEQRRSIMQGVHSQVEAVCADSSLSAQQRNEKIRQIHQQATQQANAIVTPSQMEALKSCQSSRASAHPPTGGAIHHGGGGGGPCGQLPSNSGPGAPGNKPETDLEN
jgi:hypothetical protein